MKCLILAGGFATRLYPLTLNKAKALLEFKGKPNITHIIERVPPQVDILVTTNKKFESDFFKWQKKLGRRVEICIEEAMEDGQKKGAVSAIDYWIKQKRIAEDLMIIAADNYFEFNLADLMAGFDGRTALIAVRDIGDKNMACELNKACQVGLVTLENNRVIRFDEKPPEATSSIIATGIYIIPARIFPVLSLYCNQKKQDNLGSFISFLLDKEVVRAYAFSEVWLDIGDEIKKGRLSV
jgi:glucose-1-phosphate thymidylyltransferase